jgi:hypothetical protein
VAGDHAADRPRHEADRVGGERQQRADQRLGVREEQLAEHERRPDRRCRTRPRRAMCQMI